MAAEKKTVDIPSVTFENALPIDPERSLLPIQLTGDRCIIEPIVTDDDKYLSKEANLAKPVSMKEPYFKGRIVSIGDGSYGQGIPASMRVGLIVNYWHSTGIDLEFDKVKYHLVRASDVWAYL